MLTVTLACIVILVVMVHTLLGCLVVPLQGALVIDATGHSVVLGIIVGFLVSHSLHSSYLFIGATLAGLLMNFIGYALQKIPIVAYDSAIGISFSFLFSLGVLLISLYARNIHLDIDMILLGNIEYALYDTVMIGVYAIPRIVIVLMVSLLCVMTFVMSVWRHIVTMLFDYTFALVSGVPVRVIQTLIIGMSSAVVVSSFSVTGALILVGIAAGPFGYIWHSSRSFAEFIIKSMIINTIWGLFGLSIALFFDFPIAASVAFIITTGNVIITCLHKSLF